MIRILVVDDSKVARRRVITEIKEMDLGLACEIVGEAVDGVDALEQYHRLKPDLLITDIEMPNMDGIELTQEIRKLETTLPIIVISSIANEQIKQQIKSDPLITFFPKPLKNNQLKLFLIKIEYDILMNKDL